MVYKILDNIIPYRETKFKNPPTTTYAVYNDSIETKGSDFKNLIEDHDVTIEVYEHEPDKTNESRIEDKFDLLGIPYTKQERYWLDSEKLYQVIYSFTYYKRKES